MNAELLASIAGIVFSLAFSYIPGLKDKFDDLTAGYKQLTMGITLLVVSLAVFGLSCAGLVDVGVTCDQAGAMGLVSVFIAALIANQSTYLITKR
jgi:hypothetical protein